MGKRLAILLAALTILLSLSAEFVVGGLQAYSRYQQSNLASQEHCGGQSPVHICVQTPLALYSAYYPFYLATHAPQFVVSYSSSSPLALIMSVSVAGFTQTETHTVNAGATAQALGFTPTLAANALRALTNDVNTTVHVRVTDTHNTLYYVNDSPLLLHSHELMQWVAANRLKVAAWVTPDDPAVAGLVSKAINRLPGEPPPVPAAMIGYANHASPRAVRDQVDALYDTLRLDYHMRYLSTNVPYGGPGDTSASLQDIHLPFETLQQRSGMCIELTALLASAVERIGLHAEIVIIPGHAFLGVALTPDNTQFEYWDAVQLNDNVAGDSANIAANAEYNQNAKHIVDTILISDARQAGIAPMV